MPPTDDPPPAASDGRATAAYVAPFLIYVSLMGLEHMLKLPIQIFYPIRCLASAAAILLLSRSYFSLRPSQLLASVALGVAVFVVWVAPDVLFGYRHFWLFENSMFGSVTSSVPPELRDSLAFRAAHVLGSTLLVPILEELFWRGWMMRWLIDARFLKVPLGAYAPGAFWLVALAFASDHGPYWEVGLAAGVLYNWWLVRTRNLADCMVAHSVTNGLLSAYVLGAHQWQYWL